MPYTITYTIPSICFDRKGIIFICLLLALVVFAAIFILWTYVSYHVLKWLKKNIEEKVIGLDFIMALRPVTYNLDMDAIASFNETPDSLRLEESERKAEEILQTGFIAQEVELAAKKLGYDFSGVDAPKNDKDNYGLRYSEFVVPLVKAMQEQQVMIDDLKSRLEILENN